MPGSVSVDFAGTKDEVLEFCRENSAAFPHRLTSGPSAKESPNGVQTVFVRFYNRRELGRIVDELAKLGWDLGSLLIRKYGKARSAQGRV